MLAARSAAVNTSWISATCSGKYNVSQRVVP
jgi:hypothetical protein